MKNIIAFMLMAISGWAAAPYLVDPTGTGSLASTTNVIKSISIATALGNGTNTSLYGGWTGNGLVTITNIAASDLMLLWFAGGNSVANGGNRGEIFFGSALDGSTRYAKIFWNPPHDSDSGELQVDMSGGFALGPGATSGNGNPYLSNRRFQMGIGEYHHGWLEINYDNLAKANDVLGYSLAQRFVTTYWNGSSSVANYPALRGEAYDTAGDFGVTYYGNFDTTVGGVGNTNMLGGTPVMKLHGGTTKKLEIIGSISTTLGTSFATSSGSVQFGAAGQLNFIPGSPDSFLFNYNTSRDSDFVFSDGGNSAGHYYLRMGANGNFIGKGGLGIGTTAAAVNGTLEVAGTIYSATGYKSDSTITAGGTTGAQTINKPAGRVNMAAGQSTLVVTDSLVTVNSLVFCTVASNDATATLKNVVSASGSFTITLTATATAECKLNFIVMN